MWNLLWFTGLDVTVNAVETRWLFYCQNLMYNVFARPPVFLNAMKMVTEKTWRKPHIQCGDHKPSHEPTTGIKPRPHWCEAEELTPEPFWQPFHIKTWREQTIFILPFSAYQIQSLPVLVPVVEGERLPVNTCWYTASNCVHMLYRNRQTWPSLYCQMLSPQLCKTQVTKLRGCCTYNTSATRTNA